MAFSCFWIMGSLMTNNFLILKQCAEEGILKKNYRSQVSEIMHALRKKNPKTFLFTTLLM